ncbi:MAG: amidohydrolase/deacetylase family metallohydrolase [Bryobacteraceae bacterium]|nr:amidohydrolase/deacetylase family metallohydrolase [Bryobacteraceae bacterium]
MRRLLATLTLTALLNAFEEPPFRATKAAPLSGPIIVDTDAGSDDYMAIAFLLARPDVRLEAIVVVNGLAHVDAGARNLLRLVQLSGKRVPVYLGRPMPLSGQNEFPAAWRQSADDLPGVTLPALAAKPEAKPALAYYQERLRQPARILALGPLTNLAEVLAKQPAAAVNIRELTIMGGAVHVPGNLRDGNVFTGGNALAEWNIYIDPRAAAEVFQKVRTIRLVSLDATNRVPLRMNYVQQFREGASGTPLGRFLNELLTQEEPLIRERIFYAWDPLAAVAMVEGAVSFVPAQLEVIAQGPEAGRTRDTFKGVPNATYSNNADAGAFYTAFYNAFATEKKIYDLLVKSATLIDPKNGINRVMDVAIKDGRIAAVAENIPALRATQTIHAPGYYVTPGLIDLHVHVFASTGKAGVYNGDNSVWPDGHTLRSGVTTVVDCGSSGADEFASFKQHIIDRSKTRVLAWLSIVKAGMTHAFEQDTTLMDVSAAVATAKKYPAQIVGFKTAHFEGPAWTPVERALAAGNQAGLPVIVDFGLFRPERPFSELVTKRLRKGDIYTHMYLDRVPMLDAAGKVQPFFAEAKKRGVLFDVGHGGGSFVWKQAIPATKQGLWPDSISTDLHINSMVGGMRDMLNVMSKFLYLGMPLEEVIAKSTWNPAKQIRREELGHLSVGAPADLAILSVQTGRYGFVDVDSTRVEGDRKLQGEVTIRAGRIVWDLNGLSMPTWDAP